VDVTGPDVRSGARTPADERRKPVVAAGRTDSAALRADAPRRPDWSARPVFDDVIAVRVGARTPLVERRSERGAVDRLAAATADERRTDDVGAKVIEENFGAADIIDKPRPPGVQSGRADVR